MGHDWEDQEPLASGASEADDADEDDLFSMLGSDVDSEDEDSEDEDEWTEERNGE